MDSQDFSSSDRGYRYLQHLTLDDIADRRSNNVTGFASHDEVGSRSNTSYVFVEHDDAGMSSESYLTTESSYDAEEREVRDDLANWDLEQQWLQYQSQLNDLRANQSVYSQYAMSGYSFQPEAGPPNAADGQHEHQTQEFVPDDIVDPSPVPTMHAGSSSNGRHPQNHAPTALDDQEPAFTQNQVDTRYPTQPLYNFQYNGQPYPTHNQGHNTMPAYPEPMAEDLDGLQPAEYQQADRHKHLEHQVNIYVNILNTPDIGDATGGSGRASDPGSMLLNTMDSQEWGGASAATLRPDNVEQSNPVVYSNDPRHPLHFGGQGSSPMLPAPPRSLAIPTRPRMTSSRNNSHGTAPVPMISTSSHSAQEDVLRCPLCPSEYRGVYRANTYNRHQRLKHRGRLQTWTCSVCDKKYYRSDYRLNHERRRHPELFQAGR